MARTEWTVKHPFEQRLFIENKGQYLSAHPNLNTNDIRFCAQFGGLSYYFTKSAIWISRSIPVKRSRSEMRELEKQWSKGKEKEEDEEERKEKEWLKWKNQELFYCMEFEASSSNAYIEGLQEVSQHYNYGTATAATIQAKGYNKLLYHGLYPGIDMEVIFPTDKQGFKYNLMLQPGADPAQISIRYPFSKGPKIDDAGNLSITSAFGNFMEHGPVAMQNNNEVTCSFVLKDGHSGFQLANYDPTLPLIIDPWTIPPPFVFDDKAYDIDWDYAGNCYIYGGGRIVNAHHELIKLNINGTVVWTYSVDEFGSATTDKYGDFAVDRESQSVYIVEGTLPKAAKAIKLNSNGLKTATYEGDSLLQEMWRIVINSCTHQAVVGGGGTRTPSNHAYYLDTNLVNIKPLQTLNTNDPGYDVWGLALDNVGNCYMAFATVPTPTFDNVMLKAPLPSLTPVTWMVPTHYEFLEISSINYNKLTNGYNGMCVSNNNLYTYDSYSLKKWSTATGVMLDSTSVNVAGDQSLMEYGGLTADDCEYIFLTTTDHIQLKKPGTINPNTIFTAPDMIYDLNLGRDNILYACGKGFVSAIQVNIPECNPILTSKQITNVNCGTMGAATVNVSGGTPPYNFLWNTVPVQTTNTIANLAPGTYIVTITDSSCPKKIKKDTIVIAGSDNLTISMTSIPVLCNSMGTAMVKVVKGSAPFTYSWAPVAGTDSVLTNIPAGTYTVTVQDKNGCIQTASVGVKDMGASPTVIIAATNTNCKGGANGTLTASVTGGVPPYTYLWSPGGATTATISNLKAGVYFLTVTAANGCKINDSARVLEPASVLTLKITATDELCENTAATATVVATGGAAPYSYLWSNGATAPAVSKIKAGTYSITVTDKSGCAKTDSIVVKNIADYGPKASFTANPLITDIFNPTIKFYDKSIGATNWWWNFKDGTTDSIQHPLHTYKEGGTYAVTLTIVNAFGCKSTAEIDVIIRPFWSFYIPNSFTPNDDGINDTFGGKAEGIYDYQMIIFNRWGEQIYSTNNLSYPWDGKANNGKEIAQQDVYLYLVTFKDSKGKEQRYTGIVTLVK